MNPTELSLQEELTKQGWMVLRRGWPDFCCIRKGENGREVMLVEVKPCRSSRLKHEQREVLLAMTEQGVPSFRWSPDMGLERVTAELVMKEAGDLPCQKRPSEMTRDEKLQGLNPRAREEALRREREGLPWH